MPLKLHTLTLLNQTLFLLVDLTLHLLICVDYKYIIRISGSSCLWYARCKFLGWRKVTAKCLWGWKSNIDPLLNIKYNFMYRVTEGISWKGHFLLSVEIMPGWVGGWLKNNFFSSTQVIFLKIKLPWLCSSNKITFSHLGLPWHGFKGMKCVKFKFGFHCSVLYRYDTLVISQNTGWQSVCRTSDDRSSGTENALSQHAECSPRDALSP